MQIGGHSKIKGSRKSKPQTTSWTRRNLESSDQVLESASTHDTTTFGHCFYCERNERCSRTDHNSKTKNEENHTISQRPSEVSIELPLGWEAGRRHPCDCGCRLGWRPKDKVLHEWRCVGNRSVLRSRVGSVMMVFFWIFFV